MAEPLTLALVATTVVTEGIKFLYGQAAEAIKRWRESRNATPSLNASPAETAPQGLFAGELAPLEFHLDQVGPLEKHLLTLRRALADHAAGLSEVDSSDVAILEAADALRRVMEAVYQQRLTFVGEQRPASGPVVIGTLDVGSIAGKAAAVEAKLIAGGHVTGSVRANEIKPGGSASAVTTDIIGGRS